MNSQCMHDIRDRSKWSYTMNSKHYYWSLNTLHFFFIVVVVRVLFFLFLLFSLNFIFFLCHKFIFSWTPLPTRNYPIQSFNFFEKVNAFSFPYLIRLRSSEASFRIDFMESVDGICSIRWTNSIFFFSEKI